MLKKEDTQSMGYSWATLYQITFGELITILAVFSRVWSQNSNIMGYSGMVYKKVTF